MKITHEVVDDLVVLIPAGNFVASEVMSVKSHVEALMAQQQHNILLDMSQISFMDSSGLDTVMTINKQVLNAGGFFAGAAPRDNVLKIFRVTWADQKIPLTETRADAVLLIQKMREDSALSGKV